MSLKIHFDSAGSLGDVTIHRAGAAEDDRPLFEISRRSGNELSYLVSLSGDERLTPGNSQPVVVAEIELAAVPGQRIAITIDPKLTTLTDRGGRAEARVAGGTLRVSGALISPEPAPSRLQARH
jgi:hypothetical protein